MTFFMMFLPNQIISEEPKPDLKEPKTSKIAILDTTPEQFLFPIESIKPSNRERLFHPIIEAGAISHIWLGEARPSAESLANFIIKTFRWTKNDQVAFSPEFTNCRACGRTARGLLDSCPYCDSTDLECITRITGYFTKLSSWNKGKLGELKDRYRNKNQFANPASEPLQAAAGRS